MASARPTVLVGCGLPAVGKSTVLRTLQRRSRGSLYLDKDAINAALLAGGGKQEGSKYFSAYYDTHVRDQTYNVMFAVARDNVAADGSCQLVVLDGQFGDKLSTPAIQDRLRELAASCTIKLVYFHCGRESQMARMRARAEPRDEAKYGDFEALRQQMLHVHERDLCSVPHLRVDTDALDAEQCVHAVEQFILQSGGGMKW
jgi:predicted kinase